VFLVRWGAGREGRGHRLEDYVCDELTGCARDIARERRVRALVGRLVIGATLMRVCTAGRAGAFDDSRAALSGEAVTPCATWSC